MASASDEVTAADAPPSSELAQLNIAADAGSPAEVPAHRSHDPVNNMKRSDPFQFGSRYLTEGDNVFEFNAWDHVETDDAYKAYTEEQLEKQRQSPVSDFDKSKLETNFQSGLDFFFSHILRVVMIALQQIHLIQF